MTFTYALDEPIAADLDEAKGLVGGKAANLGVMAWELRLPVPPGFAITTATCREFLTTGWPAGLDEEIRARRRSAGASATPTTRCSSASARAHPSRCPG